MRRPVTTMTAPLAAVLASVLLCTPLGVRPAYAAGQTVQRLLTTEDGTHQLTPLPDRTLAAGGATPADVTVNIDGAARYQPVFGTQFMAPPGDLDAVRATTDHFLYGHLPKWVRRGAVAIGSDQTSTEVGNVAFRNPDGTVVVVVANAAPAPRSVRLSSSDGVLVDMLPAKAVATYRWAGGPVVPDERDGTWRIVNRRNTSAALHLTRRRTAPFPALLAFNVGVELAQLATVALVFPSLLDGELEVRRAVVQLPRRTAGCTVRSAALSRVVRPVRR